MRLRPAEHLALGVVETRRRVIRRDHLEDAVTQRFPHHRLIGLVARRRAAHAFGALKIGLGKIVLGQEEILRTGFGIDPEAASLRPADLLDRLAAGDMDEQDRDADDLGEADRAVRRLGSTAIGRDVA